MEIPRGIFAVYKPSGPTSHDVIAILRRATGIQRIGHAGTLDPAARGVLVVGIGREATRQLNHVVKKEKEYLATITLGMESTTDDAEGELRQHEVSKIPTELIVGGALQRFVGTIRQVPPQYSAVKVSGKPAHRRMRRGEQVQLAVRSVIIKEIELVTYQWPRVTIRLITGPGVYIRSIARDLGQALGVGGYLTNLERTRVGEFTAGHAVPLEQFGYHSRRASGTV